MAVKTTFHVELKQLFDIIEYINNNLLTKCINLFKCTVKNLEQLYLIKVHNMCKLKSFKLNLI